MSTLLGSELRHLKWINGEKRGGFPQHTIASRFFADTSVNLKQRKKLLLVTDGIKHIKREYGELGKPQNALCVMTELYAPHVISPKKAIESQFTA